MKINIEGKSFDLEKIIINSKKVSRKLFKDYPKYSIKNRYSIKPNKKEEWYNLR